MEKKQPGEEFYTLKGYQDREGAELTTAMEDYLEMICRLTPPDQVVRVSELSRQLHVKPPSATRMLSQLSRAGYVSAEKYGYARLTEKGRQAGNYLLYRHEVIHRFLRALNRTDNELEQVEKIEHFLNRETVENLAALTAVMEK